MLMTEDLQNNIWEKERRESNLVNSTSEVITFYNPVFHWLNADLKIEHGWNQLKMTQSIENILNGLIESWADLIKFIGMI